MQPSIGHIAQKSKLQLLDVSFFKAARENISNGGLHFEQGKCSDVSRSVKFLSDFIAHTDRKELIGEVTRRVEDVAKSGGFSSARDERCITAIFSALASKMAAFAEKTGYVTPVEKRFGKMREVRMSSSMSYFQTNTDVQYNATLQTNAAVETTVVAVVAAVVVAVAAAVAFAAEQADQNPAVTSMDTFSPAWWGDAALPPMGSWDLPILASELRMLTNRMLSTMHPAETAPSNAAEAQSLVA